MLKSMAMNEYLEFSHSWVFLLKTNPGHPCVEYLRLKTSKTAVLSWFPFCSCPNPSHTHARGMTSPDFCIENWVHLVLTPSSPLISIWMQSGGPLSPLFLPSDAKENEPHLLFPSVWSLSPGTQECPLHPQTAGGWGEKLSLFLHPGDTLKRMLSPGIRVLTLRNLTLDFCVFSFSFHAWVWLSVIFKVRCFDFYKWWNGLTSSTTSDYLEPSNHKVDSQSASSVMAFSPLQDSNPSPPKKK